MIKLTEEQLFALIELQGVESQAIKIQTILDKVSSRIKALDDQYESLIKDIEVREKEYLEIKGEYEEVKTTAETNEARIKKSSEDIKKVQTNKEYQTLLREIDENKKKQAYFDEEMIRLLEAITEADKTINKFKDDSVQLQEKTIQEKENIKNESVKEEKELQKIVKNKEKINKKLDENILKKFNQIIKQQYGIALVPVKNAICGGCFINIPPQMYIELQKERIIHFCPYCHKMLYYLPEKNEK